MTRRSPVVVPLTETSSTLRRGSTAEDHLVASADSPEIVSLQRPSMPGASRSCPIEIDDGEDAGCTTTPVKQARQRATTIRDDPSRTRPSSAQKPRSEQPKTPGRNRPQPQRETASDPGLRRPRQEAFQDRPITYVQTGKLPCGHKLYSRSGGAWHERHRSNCEKCLSQPSDQVGTEESGNDDILTLPTRTVADSNPAESDGIRTQAHSRNTDTTGETPQTERGNGDNSAPLVHHRLLQAAKEKLTTNEKEGYLYILSCAQQPGLLKFGYSSNPSHRGKQHRARCGLTMTWVHVTNCAVNVKRAEKLAKLDLLHLQKDYRCASCAQTHTEWFQVDEQRAKHVADRWIAWINDQTPYAPNGALAPLWTWLLDYGRAPRPSFAEHDHAARWAHWDAALLSPSSSDARTFARTPLKSPQTRADLPPSLPPPPRSPGPGPSPSPSPSRLAAVVCPRSTGPDVAEKKAGEAKQKGVTYNTIINNLVVGRDFVGSAG
ncbi:hypothetical protein SVAN01_06612 [Stagonosporopsis vannaccii]|nr:hypothetical protein SVAN01_06612 [Stagonosporopsis vannaccii]